MSVRIVSDNFPLIVIGVFASLAIPNIVGAAEWTAEPAVTVRREYHDNINLSTQPQSSVLGTIVQPNLDLGMKTPAWLVAAGVSVTQRRYSGGASALDQDDTTLIISTVHWAERSSWQLNASHLKTSLLTGDQINSDTGVVQTQRQSETKSISPGWTWLQSETSQLQIQYLWSEVSYGNSQNVGLFDYRYQSASATYTKHLSERNQVFVTGGYSRFDVPLTGFRSDTGNAQVGITRRFSETTIGTLQAGLRNTESFTRGGNPIYTRFSTIVDGQIVDVLVQTGVTQDSTDQKTSTVYSGNLERKYEKSIVKMGLSSALSPSGSGGQAEQYSYYASFSNPLTERLTLAVDGNVVKTRNFQGNITNSELTYYEFNSGLDWQWMRDLSLNLRYRHSRAKRIFETTAADSNAIYLSLIYRPLKMSMSR